MMRPRVRGLPGWMAAGVCVSVVMLTWFGYHAVRGWQRSSAQLVERRADEAADLLATALTRDMRAVQKSVLASPDWDTFMLDPPFDVSNVVASAFARYPYPESFFAARSALTPAGLVFFTRSDRLPVWLQAGEEGRTSFPVSVRRDEAVAMALIARITADAAHARRFSVFQLQLGGLAYQVISRLIYRDQFREHLDGVFGFMVNIPWVRRYYFPELTNQVARIGAAGSGLALAVVDEKGEAVARTQDVAHEEPRSVRPFPVIFFDPLLVALDPPADLPTTQWAVQVSSAADPTLAAAIRGADRTLIIAALAAVSLAFGFVLSARAARASANLAEMRSEFVATVTHELKTPIATIRAVGDTLVSGRLKTSEGQREYAQIAVQEAKRLTRLVDNLLAVSRITDVTDVYSFEPLAIDVIVDEVLQEFHHQLSSADFDVQVEIAPDLPPLRGDRTAIGLMLDNLVDNAIRYSPHRKSLRIEAHRDGDQMVVLEVKDKGRGIPADEINQVTRKFVRGRHAPSTGTGLGLAIVKRIVTDHGGRLAIQSAMNVGTTVTVSIPAHEDDEETNSRH
jgi:signal transduction histidine kinase